MDRAEEKRLIQAAQQGEREAFAALYRAHIQTIFRYVAFRVSDRQLAEDLTADVFTKAIEGLDRYQDTGRPFLAWLYRIAHARVVDHYRRQSRRPDDSDVEAQPLPYHEDADERMMQERATRILQEAISTLTEDQQQVIILRFIEGYRIEAVAQVMGKKPNAIKALQHRAIRALGRYLERNGLDLETIMAGLT